MSAQGEPRFPQCRIIIQRDDSGQVVRATNAETGEDIPANAETGAILMYGRWYVLAPTTEIAVFPAREEP